MENAAEALKMAGMVLMFMIALSVSIVSFGKARETADIVMSNMDRETTYIDGNMYYKGSGSTRKVGIETVIPTLKRVFNEGYEIEFKFPSEDAEPIYTIKATSSTDDTDDKKIFRIKDNKFLDASTEGKNAFLNGILYGTSDEFKKYYKDTIKLPTKSLYDRLKNGVEIIEQAGEYKIEKESDANEEIVRVIKYVIN